MAAKGVKRCVGIGSFKRKDESKAMPSHDLKVRGSWGLKEGEEREVIVWRAGDVIIIRLILRSTRTGTSYGVRSTEHATGTAGTVLVAFIRGRWTRGWHCRLARSRGGQTSNDR